MPAVVLLTCGLEVGQAPGLWAPPAARANSHTLGFNSVKASSQGRGSLTNPGVILRSPSQVETYVHLIHLTWASRFLSRSQGRLGAAAAQRWESIGLPLLAWENVHIRNSVLSVNPCGFHSVRKPKGRKPSPGNQGPCINSGTLGVWVSHLSLCCDRTRTEET